MMRGPRLVDLVGLVIIVPMVVVTVVVVAALILGLRGLN